MKLSLEVELETDGIGKLELALSADNFFLFSLGTPHGVDQSRH